MSRLCKCSCNPKTHRIGSVFRNAFPHYDNAHSWRKAGTTSTAFPVRAVSSSEPGSFQPAPRPTPRPTSPRNPLIASAILYCKPTVSPTSESTPHSLQCAETRVPTRVRYRVHKLLSHPPDSTADSSCNRRAFRAGAPKCTPVYLGIPQTRYLVDSVTGAPQVYLHDPFRGGVSTFAPCAAWSTDSHRKHSRRTTTTPAPEPQNPPRS